MTARIPKPRAWNERVSFSDPAYRPYAMALGQIALAWNMLHTRMALLFCTVMGGGFSNQYLSVWHAIRNDAAQRAVLLGAAKNSFGYDSALGRAVYAEVEWLNGQAWKIEQARDDALHSPLWRDADNIVRPVSGLGHTRAQKLAAAKRGLLAEFRWCRDAANTLTNYVTDLDAALAGSKPWPDRPSLPNRGDRRERAAPQKPKAQKPGLRPPRESSAP